MRFLVTTLLAFMLATLVLAAPAVTTEATSNLLMSTDDANCPKASRNACGQYMLEDGTRQDFESQVFKCIPRDEFHCNYFNYAKFDPFNPGKRSHMVGAKVDPGCTCTFYTNACNGKEYTETWEGWESDEGSPPWIRAAYTDKKFQGWWCYEKW